MTKEFGPVSDAVEQIAAMDKIKGIRLVEPFIFGVVNLDDEIWRDPGDDEYCGHVMGKERLYQAGWMGLCIVSDLIIGNL